jgi:hypothetical protein
LDGEEVRDVTKSIEAETEFGILNRRRLQGRVRGLTATVAVLALALVGLGALTVYNLVAESDTAIPGEIDAVLEDYFAAWNENDSEAFLALTTDDYKLEYGGVVLTAQQIATDMTRLEKGDFVVEVIGDPIRSGDGPVYHVAHASLITERGFSPQNVMTVYTIVERDGDFLISHHSSFHESVG